MRVLVQRVTEASVETEGAETVSIGSGLLIFVGITGADTNHDIRSMADKVANLRIFEDSAGRMNLSALDRNANNEAPSVLLVSQFTLYADVRKGRRPSFTDAARPDHAAPMIEAFARRLGDLGLEVAQGVFGAHMMVSLVNDGPVTLRIDSDDLRRPRDAGGTRL